MKKTILFSLITTMLLLKSTSNAQEVFDAKQDSWVMCFPSLVIGENFIKQEANSRTSYDKIGTLDFSLNNIDNPYVGLVITPVVAGISKDSSLALLNLHSSAIKVKTITLAGDTLITVLEPGGYKKIMPKDWGKTDKIFLFQEIFGAYEGTLFYAPKYLINEKDIEYVSFINTGFLPNWNKKLGIYNIKLTENGPEEIKFEFNVRGKCLLDKRAAIRLNGIYLSYSSEFASGEAKINPLKSGTLTDSTMSFSIVKPNRVSESDFVLEISPLEFQKVLKITKEKNGFHMAFYSSHDTELNRVEGLSSWWVKNNTGKQF